MSLMVSVSGIRGIVGHTLTPAIVLEYAQAYGRVLDGAPAVVGRDSRPSGPMFEAAATAGLLSAGCNVTRLGLVTTPTVGRAIRDGRYAGGLIITASHNPRAWNGMKFLDELGVAPDPARVERISEFRNRSVSAAPPRWGSETIDAEAGQRHVAAVLAACETPTWRLKGLPVVLDSINGAGCQPTPMLLAALGCQMTHINGEPTGQFAHAPEPIRENLAALGQAVRQAKAAIGLAQDPDADRLALVDERGEYIGEEYTLALATLFVLQRRPGPVAANLSTSRLIDDIAARFNQPVIRTPVGEAHVARAMLAQQCVIGGEGNGGVIDPRICFVRDSLSAISLVLQLMATTDRTLSALVAELPPYAMIKQKCDLPLEGAAETLEAIAFKFANQRVSTADGVRVDFPQSWVHVRASNTEPILRIIAEARTEPEAAGLVALVRAAGRI